MYEYKAVWHKYRKGSYPQENVEVIAYSEKWVDEDFNPKGQRVGFRTEDGFVSAFWWDYQDDYMAISKQKYDNNKDFFEKHINKTEPQYWTEIPEFKFSDKWFRKYAVDELAWTTQIAIPGILV